MLPIKALTQHIKTYSTEPLASTVLEYALDNLNMPEIENDEDENAVLIKIRSLMEYEDFDAPLTFSAREKVMVDRALDAYIKKFEIKRRSSDDKLMRKLLTQDIRELRIVQEKVEQKL
jgi:hypothetical protein